MTEPKKETRIYFRSIGQLNTALLDSGKFAADGRKLSCVQESSPLMAGSFPAFRKVCR